MGKPNDPEESLHSAGEVDSDGAIPDKQDKDVNDMGDEVHFGVSYREATTHLIKANFGCGLLALPYCYAQAGWLFSAPLLVVTVSQSVYAMSLIARLRRTLAWQGVKTLGDVAGNCLGGAGRVVVETFLFISQFGVCCVFVSVVGHNLSELIQVSRMHATLIIAPFFILLAIQRNVGQLGLLSLVGNAAMAGSVLAALICSIFQMKAVGTRAWSDAMLPVHGSGDFVLLVSCVFYMFEGIGLALPVENAMKNPKDFPKALVTSTSFLLVVFLLTGTFCGVAYRYELQTGSIISFLFTFYLGTPIAPVMLVINGLVTASILFTFPLQLFPAAEVLSINLQDLYQWFSGSRSSTPRSVRLADMSFSNRSILSIMQPWVLQRVSLVIIFVYIAAVVDNLAVLVSLVGAVGLCGLALTPMLCHLALVRRGVLPLWWPEVILDVLIILFCTTNMVLGTMVALQELMADFAHKGEALALF